MLTKELGGSLYVPIAVPFMPAAASNAGGCGFKAPNKLQIQSATLTWNAAITGANTNNFTISFFNRTSGAGTVAWATAITYASGTNATKATAITLTLSSTAADLVIAADDYIAAELSTTGSGLLCPGGIVNLVVRNYGV